MISQSSMRRIVEDGTADMRWLPSCSCNISGCCCCSWTFSQHLYLDNLHFIHKQQHFNFNIVLYSLHISILPYYLSPPPLTSLQQFTRERKLNKRGSNWIFTFCYHKLGLMGWVGESGAGILLSLIFYHEETWNYHRELRMFLKSICYMSDVLSRM